MAEYYSGISPDHIVGALQNRFFYGLRRTDQGELFVGKIDQLSRTDSLEINKSGYQNKKEVWTNPNKAYARFKGFNYFQPSKGWSSGPTALWLASQHQNETIYILGFDYMGVDDGKKFNNIFADTMNYKKSTDSATFFGNWMRQTANVVQTNPKKRYIRVIDNKGYIPKDLRKFDNLKHITVEEFLQIIEDFKENP